MRRAALILPAVFVAATVLAEFAGCALFRGKPEGQKFCPVTGMFAKKENAREYKGRTIYFADQDCIAKFNQNPEKYFKIYELVLNGANQRDPVTNTIIDPACHYQYGGRTVYFSAEKSRDEFIANPEKYAYKLEDLQKERLEAQPLFD
jgi:YHS domain-containing protein